MVEQEARGLTGTGSRHGRSATSMESAASMETMDMEDRAVCMVVQAPPQGGPSSRSTQMVPTQGLERQESKELSPVKGKEQCIGNRQVGPEEEEQCRRSRHSSGGTGVPSKQVLDEEGTLWRESRSSVTGDAAKSQAEKIPKSVLSIVSQIVKLNENNWAIWEPMFMDCIRPIKNTKQILTGEISSDHTYYDEELNSHLLGLILSSCDHSPESSIHTYTVREQGKEEQLGSTLYKKLKAALTINDEVKLSAIHDRVHEIKLVHRNVVNLGKELDRIWNDAARLGSRMDEKLKKSTLYRCVKDDWLYTQTVDSLKAAQPGCSYEYTYHALTKKHQEAEISGHIRAATRLAGNRNITNQASGPGQILNQEGYNRGRCDPANPNEPAVRGLAPET
ncbi:related to retrotransposon protein [Ustilago sp. UG-2017b]|nr:related to retrotransposon protein [Ustilago sp. UG-2017b]